MARNPAELLGSATDLPPLPAVAAKVLAIADDERSSANDLAQVLAADQALTARLIRVSNSAYYGFSRKISTVREAVVSLGFKQVRQIAVGASMVESFRFLKTEYFDLDLFWGHSMAVAVTAEALAKKTRSCRPEDAFTAGVLHDIGRLIIRQQRPTEFDRAVQMARTGGISQHAAEIRSTGYAHDQVGKALGDMWKFPAQMVDAIEGHHDASLRADVHGLPGVLAMADRLILHYGLYCGYDLCEEQTELRPLPKELAQVEAAAGGIDFILERAFAFIEAASGTPDRWHTRAA